MQSSTQLYPYLTSLFLGLQLLVSKKYYNPPLNILRMAYCTLL